MLRQKLCVLLMVLVGSGESLFAGALHDLIADKTVSDEKIQEHIAEFPLSVREDVEHPKLKPNQKMGVLEAIVAAERWDLVIWILNKYPRLDVNRPLGTLDNTTVLGYAIKQKAAHADLILKTRPGAEPIWNRDFANNWEYEENKYLRVAAFHSNWKLFGQWAEEFSATRMFPDLSVQGRNGNTRVVKKSILGYAVHDKQYAAFADILMHHLDGDEKVESALLSLAQRATLQTIFKKVIYLELMRRVPSRLAADSDWMKDVPLVIELRSLMNAAAFQTFKDAAKWKLPGILYIGEHDRDLKRLEALNEAVLDTLIAHM